MATMSRGGGALLGLVLIGGFSAVVPAAAAPPPAPDYQCTTSAGPTAANPVKIMIAGDSITNGSAGDYTWRSWLWKDLVSRGANVDFVGRFHDTLDANTRVAGSRQYADCDFDQDHESRPGVKLWTGRSDRIALGSPNYVNDPTFPYYPGASSWLRGAVAEQQPSILVLFAGANDLARSQEEPVLAGRSESAIASGVIGILRGVIAEARAAQPGIDIVLTTVPETAADNRYSRYNDLLPTVVSSLSTPGERLVIATMPSWAAHTWDGVHPDAYGEIRIAASIAGRLAALHPSLAGPANQLPSVPIGPRATAVLDPAEVLGSGRARLTWTLPFGSDRTLVFSRNKSSGGPWVREADLVLGSLRSYFPEAGTAVCSPADVIPQRPCTAYTVTGLSGGTEYEFALVSAKGQAISPDLVSNVVSVLAVGGVGRVAPPRATAGIGSVTVRWENLVGVPGYEVQWRQAGASAWLTTTSPGSSRTISGLVAGRAHEFRVRAQGSTSWSVAVRGVPRARALAAGRKPVLSAVKGTRILLRWGASAGARSYQVQQRAVGGRWAVVATTSGRSLMTSRLVKGRTYEFRVRPYDGDVGGVVSPAARRKAV